MRWFRIGSVCVFFFGAVGLPRPGAAATASFGPVIFTQAASARSIAMGETGVADPTDPLNTFFNPALIPRHTGITGSFFFDEVFSFLVDDARLKGGQLAASHAFDLDQTTALAFSAQLNYSRIGFGEVNATNTQGQLQGTFTPTEEYIGITIAGELRWSYGAWVSVGGSVKNFDAEYYPASFNPPASGSAEVTAYDIGSIIGFRFVKTDGWEMTGTVAIASVNNGDDYTDPISLDASGESALVRSTNYGMSLQIEGPDRKIGSTTVPTATYVVNVDWRNGPEDSVNQFGIGGEVGLFQLAFGRIGWWKPDTDGISYVTVGVGFGIPTRWFSFRMDYSETPFESLGDKSQSFERDRKVSVFLGVPLPPQPSF